MVLTPSAHADLIVNGNFAESTHGNGQLNDTTTLTGWTSARYGDVAGYNFLFAPGTLDTTGASGTQYGTLTMWGSNNGGADVLTAPPGGGNIVAADGAFEQSTISQTLHGLTIGAQYNVSFYFAGAQQQSFNGPTTEQFQVAFGGETQNTPVLNNASHGFTGWQSELFTFTADATSDVLSFLAIGTPTGVPPFSLLSGVTANEVPPVATPEPSTLIGGGLVMLALGAGSVRMFRKTKRA